MNKIQVLDNSLINKIAAGEVVERPASVVKEMVENSIDAGSKSITVEIKDGGTSYIRITDNGCGIPKDEVKIAFLRHATSKIRSFDDLTNVLSLGFRGEALSSIASVAQVEMITKQTLEKTGYRITIDGGQIITANEIGSSDGTSIIVRNLFYNTPARRKFLKKPATEATYISDIMEKFALGHPEISFKYINNSVMSFQTNGNKDLKTACLYIYGKDVANKLIPLEFKKDELFIQGYLGKPEICRGNRNHGNMYINGRYIKSQLLQSAIEEGYKTRLPIGKFPLYILNINVNAEFVDVNVHPTKLEVRFRSEELVYQYILEAIKNSLDNQNLIPEAKFEQPRNTELENTKKTVIYDQTLKTKGLVVSDYNECENDVKTYQNVLDILYKTNKEEETQEETYEKIQTSLNVDYNLIQQETNPLNSDEVTEPIVEMQQENVSELKEIANYKIIGHAFRTYWLVEWAGKLLFIDQHAAHERVLYDELINNIKNSMVNSQQLICPEVLKLNDTENRVFMENKKLISDFGFDIEEFGENTYAIRGVPNIWKGCAYSQFFKEILDRLTVQPSVDMYDTKLEEIASIACKAAVKANDNLSIAEAEALINIIMKSNNPFSCPHGRPTMIEMNKYEIDKKFKRV